MTRLNQDSELLARDFRMGEEEVQPGVAQPISQNEIDDLLFNDGIPAPERLEKLRGLREQLSLLEAGEDTALGQHDPRAALGEIERVIGAMEALDASGAVETSFDVDPLSHRETLSPDDDALLELEEAETREEQAAQALGEDAEVDTGVPLDPAEWDDGDGFDPARGVR